jgi:hypothetical protein
MQTLEWPTDMNVVENFSLLQQVSVKIINVQFCRLRPEQCLLLAT